LYQIECGKTETPRAGTINRIARALGVSVDDLMSSERPWAGDGAATRDVSTVGVTEGAGDIGMTRPRLASWAAPREEELEHKFQELLRSPLREGVIRLVEASYRLLSTESERSAI
jgi:transcriptional regulator with XRE-family HTH domain